MLLRFKLKGERKAWSFLSSGSHSALGISLRGTNAISPLKKQIRNFSILCSVWLLSRLLVYMQHISFHLELISLSFVQFVGLKSFFFS